MSEPVVQLREGREVALKRFHPWVFSGAVADVRGRPGTGETVEVRGADGAFLARGAYSPESTISVRAWTFREDLAVDVELFRRLLEEALRQRVPDGRVGDRGMRLVNAESDWLPGLVVDRYADVTVCQFLSAGARHWQPVIVELLQELLPGSAVFERSDTDSRTKEGLPESHGLLAGSEPLERITIREGPWRYAVDVRRGQKTGFYLDQRENRGLLARYAPGADVLDVFAYTGAFGTVAAGAGARSLVSVDLSEEALATGRDHLEANGLTLVDDERIPGDAFEILRALRRQGRSFDVAVLDPPKFVHARTQRRSGARGYKDVNLQAFHLLRPGGTLFTFSCSGHVDDLLFPKIVADAAADAGRRARILHRLGAPVDHPVALSFPEGRYLTGLVCRVDDAD